MEKVMLDHTGCVCGRCGADVIMRSENNSKGQDALRGEYAVVKNATKFTTSAFPINKSKDCFYNKIGVQEPKRMIKCKRGDKMRTSNFLRQHLLLVLLFLLFLFLFLLPLGLDYGGSDTVQITLTVLGNPSSTVVGLFQDTNLLE